jgi:hypothetical protein
VLGLVGANAVSVVLLGALYAVAGARWLPQPAFLACLAAILAIATTLWVRAEAAQGRGRDALARFGRIVFALLVVVVATPPIALFPVFWLDTQLPDEAGLRPMLAPLMALVLIALLLTTLVNAVGALVIVAGALRRRQRP